MNNKRIISLVPLVTFIVIVASTGIFYKGRYQPPDLPIPDLEQVVRPVYQAKGFTDFPLVKKGSLLIDNSHWNSYEESELSIFLSRLTARGLSIDYTGLGNENEEVELEIKLRKADAFAVILPWQRFSEREVELVIEFVEKGGRLLLVGDATRSNEINSLSQTFGITFEDDYIYNVREYEANFRNIYLHDFQSDALTKGMNKIVFYTASTINTDGKALVLTDENTFSSKRERTGKFAAAVRTTDNRVVAISDFSFMISPYNSLYDNDQFISNLADFLSQGERSYYLADFPNFLGKDSPFVVLRTELIPVAQDLKTSLSVSGFNGSLSKAEDPARDNIFIGLWEDRAAVEYYLANGGISIGDTLETPVFSGISLDNTALIYFHDNSGKRMLIVLGGDKEMLGTANSLLVNGGYRDYLVNNNIALILNN